jgi:hypothetical protein
MMRYPDAVNLTQDCISMAWNRSAAIEHQLRDNTCVLVSSTQRKNELCPNQNAISVLAPLCPIEPLAQRRCRLIQIHHKDWYVCTCSYPFNPSREHDKHPGNSRVTIKHTERIVNDL